MNRLGLASVIGWLALAGCSPSAPTGLGPGDGGVDGSARPDGGGEGDGGGVDVAAPGDAPVKDDAPAVTDVPKGADVPAGEDAPAGEDGGLTDVPVGEDAPVGLDVPMAADVPVGDDVPAPFDVPVAVDVPVGVDVPAARDVPAAVDVPAVDPCLAPVNLNAAGTLSGNTLRYTGDNSLTAAATTYVGTCGRPGHVLAFSYTPRASTRLRISTDNPGTPVTFDTVVFAQDRCVATGATGLGCDDDVNDGTRVRASVFVSSPVTAGRTVFLFVAGYEPPTGAMYTSVGPFELTVLEIPTVPAGSACDPAGETSVCAAGSSCRTVGAGSVCLADGVAGATCRAAAPRCDATLECNASSVCQTTTGTNGGLCRSTSVPCDAGLACSPTTARCRPAVADGAACDPAGVTNACLDAAQCLSGTCRRFWRETALPAPTFLDACTSGTRVALNGTSRDDTRSLAAVGIPWAFSFFGAPQTQLWPSTNGFLQFGATAPTSPTRGALPSATMGPLVGIFWDDLVLRAAPASDICVATVGAAPDRRFIVEWLDAYRYTVSESHLTMEVILYERGSVIDLIYSRLEAPAGSADYVDGSRATIGLQNAAGSLFIRHAGTVSTAAGIRFTPL